MYLITFVFNPITGSIHSDIFYYVSGSGVTFITAGVLYFLVCQIPAVKKYMGFDSVNAVNIVKEIEEPAQQSNSNVEND